ncbi:MAG: tRNA pseudouridine(54/55) synthase Pus10 [Candidatus Aenigmarchaeota archaeon]|nr:tRNA pseudouridine(54/55) synthase Pus10 [Candidatus Aenigmarchaeota archaeon]
MINNIVKILEKNLCDHCLGRPFSQLFLGYKNEERGEFIRTFTAMMIDGKLVDYSKINPNNFYGFKFRQNKGFAKNLKKEKCWLCNNLFDKFGSLAKKAERKLKKIEFNNFLVGSKISPEILSKEEKIWEVTGIEFVESIKAEINRELGKKLGFLLKKPVNFKNPEIVVLSDFKKNIVEIQINSLYVFGYYKKLKRGIPQCKWGTPKKYKTSVQEIAAKPIIKATKGTNNKFSGSGREDIDARCLDWRPFVIEVLKPQKRSINLKKIQKQINKSKKVNVRGLKFCEKYIVKKIKAETGDKTYRVIVKFNKPIEKKDLKKLKSLVGIINQRTPVRVAHRRADKIRKRNVKSIKYKQKNRKTIELRVEASSGLYIKELVTGDGGRTQPSVSEILNVKATPKDLDVIKIELPKGLLF